MLERTFMQKGRCHKEKFFFEWDCNCGLNFNADNARLLHGRLMCTKEKMFKI